MQGSSPNQPCKGLEFDLFCDYILAIVTTNWAVYEASGYKPAPMESHILSNLPFLKKLYKFEQMKSVTGDFF